MKTFARFASIIVGTVLIAAPVAAQHPDKATQLHQDMRKLWTDHTVWTRDYIVAAVSLVAREGWRLLPWYRFEPATGLWRHAAGSPEPPLSLRDVSFGTDGVTYPAHRHTLGEDALDDHLAEAGRILADPAAVLGLPPDQPGTGPDVGEDFESLRWFWLPEEIAAA